MILLLSESTLVPLPITVPVAIAAMIFLALHWRSMAGKKTPRSRRRIRRANTIIQLVLVVALVYALSVVSPAREPSRYVVAWIGVILLVLGTIAIALVDSVNNVRIFNRDRQVARKETVRELRRLVPDGDRTDPESVQGDEERADRSSADPEGESRCRDTGN